MQLGGEQAKRGDGRKVYSVLNCDQLGFAVDLEIDRGVDLVDIQIFVNCFWFDVIFGPNFWSEFLPGCLSDHDAHGLFVTAVNTRSELDFRRFAPLVTERVVWELNFLNRR